MTDEALEGTDKFADAIVPHPKFSRSRDPKKAVVERREARHPAFCVGCSGTPHTCLTRA
jgi:hypothetical protein